MQKVSCALFTLLLSATAISHAGNRALKRAVVQDANVQKKVIRVKSRRRKNQARPQRRENECDRVWQRLDNGPSHEEVLAAKRQRKEHYKKNRKARRAALMGASAQAQQ